MAHPVLMKVTEPKPIKPLQQHKAQGSVCCQVCPSIGYPCLKVNPAVLVIQLFSSAYEGRVRLLSRTTRAESTMNPRRIPSFGPSKDSRVTTLPNMVPNPELTLIDPPPAKVASVKTCQIPLRIFRPRERWQCHHRGAETTRMNALHIFMRRKAMS